MDNLTIDIREAAQAAYDKLTADYPGIVVGFGDFYQGFVSGVAWGQWQESRAQQQRIVEAIEKLRKDK